MEGENLTNILGGATPQAVIVRTETGPVSSSSERRVQSDSDEVKLSLSDTQQIRTSDIRRRTNDFINIINVTSEATTEIEQLVESISGIVDQVASGNVPEGRTGVLQKEANQLIEEIKSRAIKTESAGVRPLAGENVRVEIEEKYGYALEIILPDTAKDAFGIGQVSFSMKDAILDTMTRVEKAKVEFKKLKDAVSEVSDKVRKQVDTVEVALQNSEASKSSVRSLDDALSIAETTHKGIGKDKESALASFNKLGFDSLVLVQS
jgi:flagellin-like hook-associated protein FlgL